MSVVDQIRDDARTAMKDGDRKRSSALRMIQNVLQLDEKEGKGDAVAALQRERKKRIEAAEAYTEAGRTEQAADERFEAELIDGYLPEQLADVLKVRQHGLGVLVALTAMRRRAIEGKSVVHASRLRAGALDELGA